MKPPTDPFLKDAEGASRFVRDLLRKYARTADYDAAVYWAARWAAHWAMKSKAWAALALVLLFAVTISAQTATLTPTPFQTVLDGNGDPIVGACVWTYISGTSNAVNTYTNATPPLVANTNPIIADSAGRFVAYLIPGVSYKFIYETACTPPAHGSTFRTVDPVSATPTTAAAVDGTGTAGETLTAGQCAYLSDGSGGKIAGQWYRCDSANGYSSTAPKIGMVPSTIASGAQGLIRGDGVVFNLGGLTPGATYFVGTLGAITSSAPTNARIIGQADTTTSLWLEAQDAVLPAPANGTLRIGNGTTFVQGIPSAGRGTTITTGAGTLTFADGVLDVQTSLQTVSNTAAETTVYTFAVPGGTLGTNRKLTVQVVGDQLNNIGGTDSKTIRVKYGGTTICTATIAAINAGANRGSLTADVDIIATGATNAQTVKCAAAMGDSAQNNAGGMLGNLSGTNTYTMYGTNTATVDSSVSQNLVVTFQMGSTGTNDMRARVVVTEVR